MSALVDEVLEQLNKFDVQDLAKLCRETLEVPTKQRHQMKYIHVEMHKLKQFHVACIGRQQWETGPARKYTGKQIEENDGRTQAERKRRTQGKKRRLSCKVLERMLQRISAGIYTLVVVLQVVHLNES